LWDTPEGRKAMEENPNRIKRALAAINDAMRAQP